MFGGGPLDPFASSSSSSEDDHFMSMVYAGLLDENDSGEEVYMSRAAQVNRDRAGAHERLYHHYFAPDCVYGAPEFERQFRMPRDLFLHIANALEARYPFFQQRDDARGRTGFWTLQKCTTTMRMIAYGTAADAVDEYLQMSERMVRESLYQFCRGVVEIFGGYYLQGPTEADVQKLYAAHEERHGFPGMLGSLDCTNRDWRNCPTALKGMYTGGHHGVPSLILEAVASQDLWMWHAYFGVAGSNNDRNVLDQSPIFGDMLMGKAPDAPFHVNGHHYKFGYYLADGIYPTYATIVKGNRLSHDPREEMFTKRQATARKDVERAFGVMKAKWHIFLEAARPYHLDNLRSIMYAMIIMHNMVIEAQWRLICPYVPSDPRPVLYPVGSNEYRHRTVDINDDGIHHRLHDDLSWHIWNNPRNVAPVAPPVDPPVGRFDDVPDD